MPRTAGLVATIATAALVVVPAAQAKTTTVKTTGKTVSLKVGDRLVVDLAENPSTGFGWQTVSTPSFLSRLSSKYTADPAPEGIVGSGGRRVFTYKAAKVGKGTLKLVLRRGTVKSDDDRAFTVKVTVKR